MPHFKASHLQALDYPCMQDGVCFTYEAIGNNRSLIGVQSPSHEDFFLCKMQNKKGEWLIKADPYTKPLHTSFLQYVLKAYAKASKASIITQNLTPKVPKKNAQPNSIKTVDFFYEIFQNQATLPKSIKLEIGFGSGRHLLHQASHHKETYHIGLEIHEPSLKQVDRQIQLQQLTNLHLCAYDARLFMDLIASNSIDTIYVHFPVPWDKKPHRRLYSNDFVQDAMRILKPHGTLELRTDSPNYYDYVKGVFQSQNLPLEIKVNDPIAVSSKYEDRWVKQQKTIWDLIFTSTTTAPAKKLDFEFEFEALHNGTLPSKDPIVKSDHFVHFGSTYNLSHPQIAKLLQVTFGLTSQVEHNYLIIKNDRTLHYLKPVAKASCHQKAHQTITRLLTHVA